ncbi:MAG: class I SAM-dependent methyltransferase [Chloroflexota bacterium]
MRSTTTPRVTLEPTPEELDRRNEEFWDELCGTSFARQLGLVTRDRETLEAFDRAYFGFYPYLSGYLDRFDLAGRRVLEIGLGYGSLGEALARRGADYHGLDIAAGPVRMMQHRLAMQGGAVDQVRQGSALAMPFPDGTFDYVYAIGCLHHTGDLPRSINEVRRVLVPGGQAVVMVYHAGSWRQWRRVHLTRAWARVRGRTGPSEVDVARMYDSNSSGTVAPHTEYASRHEVADLFGQYSAVEVRARNFDDLRFLGRRVIPRHRILGSPLEAWLGLDLYIVARR